MFFPLFIADISVARTPLSSYGVYFNVAVYLLFRESDLCKLEDISTPYFDIEMVYRNQQVADIPRTMHQKMDNYTGLHHAF